MKRFFIIFFVLAVSAFLAACSSEAKKESDSQASMEQNTKQEMNISPDMLATTKDLSCGMDLTKTAIADTAIYKGKLYGFCSDYCKTKFKENPEEYIAKLQEESSMDEQGM